MSRQLYLSQVPDDDEFVGGRASVQQEEHEFLRMREQKKDSFNAEDSFVTS